MIMTMNVYNVLCNLVLNLWFHIEIKIDDKKS